MYAVVLFLKTNDVEVVAGNWLSMDDKMCVWPPYRSASRILKASRDKEKPGEGWVPYPIRVLRKYGNFINNNTNLLSLRMQFSKPSDCCMSASTYILFCKRI